VESILIIGLGGFIGAIVRYLVSVWVIERYGALFPWGTVLINITGSFLLAVFFAWAARQAGLDPRVRLLIATGFFGAYTTFSTYANDSLGLALAGNWIGAMGNVLGTNVVSIVGAFLGLVVGRVV
jgi:fluoride exporter